ncbi:fungal-specific transcription factor domain-containing protein [Ganoderma leucocontextum]|nr:fungal-specific transcription factor domain-containing protein [Ganoderma leucocontextum]
MHSPQTNGTGQYSDADAVAAVQLVAYSLLGGGSTDWATPLDYACEWLAQTGIYNEEPEGHAPQHVCRRSPRRRPCDIFASITLMQPPRFLSVYKRLFGGGAGFWASRGMSPRSSAQHSELRMDALSGFPEEALLAIAEISALAHWKATELQSGSPSMRELIRRGDAIERELRERATGKSAADSVEDVKNPAIIASPSSLAAGLDVPAGMAMAPSPQPGMAGRLRSTRSPIDTTRHIIGEMFREAALLYLHTVLSDSVPGVPEIMNGVDQMAKLLNELAHSSYDRTVIFPLFLTGCLTDKQMMHEVIKHRFFMQDATNGNVLLAQTVMDEVCAAGRPPARDRLATTPRLQWASLLLA